MVLHFSNNLSTLIYRLTRMGIGFVRLVFRAWTAALREEKTILYWNFYIDTAKSKRQIGQIGFER